MKTRFRFYVVIAVIAVAVMVLAPVAIAQEHPVTPPPSEATPPQSPPETPRTGEMPATSVNPDTNVPYAAEAQPLSWSSLLFGFVLGGVMGYVLGRGHQRTPAVRHDRAA